MRAPAWFDVDSPASYAGLSIAAALLTLGLKLLAWSLTGSVGLLADALEGLVNLGAASVALWMLRIAARPPDSGHAHGHGKAEYFASGFEGALIALAAVSIIWAAWPRLLAPEPLAQTGAGLAVSALAALVNGSVAWVLLRAGRRLRSPTLDADGRHLLSDVWTSAAVIAGVALTALSGWQRLDPLLAIAVAVHIFWTGGRLLQASAAGLMDASWPPAERRRLEAILDGFRGDNIDFHAVRTRSAGARSFVSFHLLVPGRWSVQQAHDFAERIENAIAAELAPVNVLSHIEPIEDPVSHADQALDRLPPGSTHGARGR